MRANGSKEAWEGVDGGSRKTSPARYHLMTPVWGSTYVDRFLELTLPTLLSPGNLPSLPANKCVYQIYTCSEDRDRMVRAPAFKRLEKLMPVSIRRIDGMPGGHPYSTMSACHERGMRECKDIDAAFIFSPPDHVWADGAFRAMQRLLADGKRAVLVAALRMRAAEESLEEVKRHAQGWQKTIIQVPPRALVQTFLRHLHPLAIAHLCPVANSSYPGNRSPGGYYWDVNGHGLLARCCHPHVMVLWPLVRSDSINTTFDHELVRMTCPDYRQVHVVTDSDEICAFEVSDSIHHSLGWISWDALDKTRVVEWMNEWTNRYHRACLKNHIYLHARDIDDEEWRPAVEASDQLVESYLAAFRKHHSRRPDDGEYVVGRSLRGNPPAAGHQGSMRWAPRATLRAVAVFLPKLAFRAPRTVAAWIYRKMNAKLYSRIAIITGQLESRIAHLERELAYQIAENKASALHFRREIQVSSFPGEQPDAGAAGGPARAAEEQKKPRAYSTAVDPVEAVA
jgi:hypothetical protein